MNRPATKGKAAAADRRARAAAARQAQLRAERRRRLTVTVAGSVAAVAVLIGIVAIALAGHKTTPKPVSLFARPANMAVGVAAAGLSPLNAEGTVIHTHQHLDVIVNGKHVVVPQAIGIGTTASGGTFFAQIHTHDASGILHVESDKIATYTLGQFFKEWQVKLTSDCIGSNCGAGKLKAYVNGKLYSGDPNGIVLTPHEEIAIVFGGGKAPSHYSFPQGL